jgi:hypothetical protein
VVGEMPDSIPEAGGVRIRIAASDGNTGRHKEAAKPVWLRLPMSEQIG